MATFSVSTLIQHLRRTALAQNGAQNTDSELLASFVSYKDEASFEALVLRHGPMVWNVCLRVGGNPHDAEDAFQATFLVLARKASSVQPREKVANWLHGVAFRTALKARSLEKKRQARERQVMPMPEPEVVQLDHWHDLHLVLDEELSRLPENYRLPILLCDLEGKSIKSVTEQLGWPQGTLAGRLARGRELLAQRMTKRGITISGGALAVVLSEQAASAHVPQSLAASTSRVAVAVAAGTTAENLVSASVANLVKGMFNNMLLTKLKTVTVVFLAVGLVAFGSGLCSRKLAAHQEAETGRNLASADIVNGAFRPEKVPGTEITRYSSSFRQRDSYLKPEQPPNEQMTVKPSNEPDEQKLLGEWMGEERDFHFCIMFGPNNSLRKILENRPSGPDDDGTYSVDWSKSPYHLDIKWGKFPTAQTIMEFTKDGRLRIESGFAAQNSRPKEFTSESKLLTKKVKAPSGSKQAEIDAANDLEKAAFYYRTHKFGSAQFYYELIRIRYPDTDYARTAQGALYELKKHRIRLPDGSDGWETRDEDLQPQPPPRAVRAPDVAGQEVLDLKQRVRNLEQRLEALEVKGQSKSPPKVVYESPPATREMSELERRVANLEGRLAGLEGNANKKGQGGRSPRIGKIIVVGALPTRPDLREKVETAILQKLQLFPGEVLDSAALRKAAKDMAGVNLDVEVIDTEDSDYKDVLVRVKKK